VSKLNITVEIAQRGLPKIILKRPASSASQQPVTWSCRRCTAPHDSYVDGQGIKDSKDAAHALPLLPLFVADHDAFTIIEYPTILLLPVWILADNAPLLSAGTRCDMSCYSLSLSTWKNRRSKRGTSSSPKFDGITSAYQHFTYFGVIYFVAESQQDAFHECWIFAVRQWIIWTRIINFAFDMPHQYLWI